MISRWETEPPGAPGVLLVQGRLFERDRLDHAFLTLIVRPVLVTAPLSPMYVSV